MSFLDQLRDLPLEQRARLLDLDPLINSDHSGVVGIVVDFQDFFTDKSKMAEFLRACASELFAKQKNMTAYAYLRAADSSDGGRSAIEAAVERTQLGSFVRLFSYEGVNVQDYLDAIRNWVDGDQTSFESVIACVEVMPDDPKKVMALEDILRAVIEYGELDQARSCLKELGRDFKITEARFLACAILCSDSFITQEELEFAGKYGRPRDRDAFFAHACAKKSVSLIEIEQLSRQLRVKITKKHLRAILKNDCVENQTKIDAALALLDRRYSRTLRGELNELYREERLRFLAHSEIVSAEDYGQKIGMPLTPEELLMFIREWNNSNADNAFNYKPLIPWARELLLARLQDPAAPAAPAPK